VRADRNTDAIAPIMNQVGREYRVGRRALAARHATTTNGLQQSTRCGSTTAHLLPSTRGLGWPLSFAANGMGRRLSDAIDGTAHAERTAIERACTTSSCCHPRAQQLLHSRLDDYNIRANCVSNTLEQFRRTNEGNSGYFHSTDNGLNGLSPNRRQPIDFYRANNGTLLFRLDMLKRSS
jgi:hypothetical protein